MKARFREKEFKFKDPSQERWKAIATAISNSIQINWYPRYLEMEGAARGARPAPFFERFSDL